MYPLPTPDDLYMKLEGRVRFAKLDLSHAYQQVELDEESQELLVLNIHQGLLRYNACERRYSQLDKEELSVVYGVGWQFVCKFHKYLEGRKFRIQMDHKITGAVRS